MDRVHCVKITTAAFEALTPKSPDTLYFVNDSGDFSPESMAETEGDIYLGDKLLTSKGTASVVPEYHSGGSVGIRALPPMGGYKRLSTVYNRASTYINTRVYIDVDDIELEIRFKAAYNNVIPRLLGRMTGGSPKSWFGLVSSSGSYGATYNYSIKLCMRDTADGFLESSIIPVSGNVYTVRGTIKSGVATLYVRNETTGVEDLKTMQCTPSPTGNTFIWLFPNSYGTSTYMYQGQHVFHAVIRKAGKTVLEYVPMQRESDDAVGFINTVGGAFVTATSGSFNAGTELVGAVDYILDAPPPDVPVFTTGGDTTPPVPGTDGLVPSPTYAERLSFLRGDGTWQTPPSPSVMGGATGQAAGTSGLVPAPPAGGNNEKYLRGDGEWAYPKAMYGTCTQPAATVAKTVDDLSVPFQLVDGAVIFVRFSSSNTVSSPTLNVMGTGAKPIKRYGTTNAGTAASSSWNAGSVQCLVYDGTNERWTLLGWLNSTYSDFAGSSHGLVPASTANDQAKVLSGAGTWVSKQDPITAGTGLSLNGNTLSVDIGAIMRPLAVHATDDWVSYGSSGYVEAAQWSYYVGKSSNNPLNLGNFQANDRLEMSACLTAANTDDKPRQVLFHVDLMETVEGVDTFVSHLASTMLTLNPSVEGISYGSASLHILHFITSQDMTNNRFLMIEAKEVYSASGRTVRFYNSVNDYDGLSHDHASSYNINVWRHDSY